ncbi:hypothetical protein [Mesorhizobium sp. NZP2077]|uniref:hypothetical protein n=1 Tax=Mesorhizobium sp. NZP2077 TaxID=2483404 RepID=UPI00159AF617|nr:hypothetical protein [Mesorhizobium sp. NZP2077]QKC84385.1 hypothetical protein EB232_24825 [Mesorhizobium sp. NZP2077]
MTAALTAPEHSHTAAIDQAAQWLATTPPRQRPAPLVPAMREMFGLSAVEVCAAIREAQLIRARAA